MRTALVLVACSGAMVFVGATAHAQSVSPVTIYGFVNANVETVEAKGQAVAFRPPVASRTI